MGTHWEQGEDENPFLSPNPKEKNLGPLKSMLNLFIGCIQEMDYHHLLCELIPLFKN
jgi:hypothetical protein